MTTIFNPTGNLNVSWDASDLPGERDGSNEVSGAMSRCKNLRLNQNGKLVTRDGSAKLNETAIATDAWWISEMTGDRYSFAGTSIYKNEVSHATGFTSAQWSAIHYNAYNDTTHTLFALNGTDRKRVDSTGVYEWGIDAPTVAPTLAIGSDTGLTGQYNAKYTYVRKVGGAIVSESNPSPAATAAKVLDNQSLAVDVTQPTDAQVTHIRVYRTLTGGDIYYLDLEIPASITYAYGYVFDWEETDVYIAGTGNQFTIADVTHSSENTHSWEELFYDREDESTFSQTGRTGRPRDSEAGETLPKNK